MNLLPQLELLHLGGKRDLQAYAAGQAVPVEESAAARVSGNRAPFFIVPGDAFPAPPDAAQMQALVPPLMQMGQAPAQWLSWLAEAAQLATRVSSNYSLRATSSPQPAAGDWFAARQFSALAALLLDRQQELMAILAQ